MLITIPKGFNQKIDEMLVNYDNLLNSKDKIMYVLSLITQNEFKNTLHSKSIIKRVGDSKRKGFKTIITFLIENNLIWKSKNYFNGKFCTEYTIIQLEKGLTETYKINDAYFINKCKKHLAKKLNFLRPETLRIRQNIEDLVLPLEIRQKYKLPNEFFHQKGVVEFCSYNNITEHCNNSGRVFNAISGMKSDLRHCFVHRDGSNLAEIDISSAQYYFISVDMMNYGLTDSNLNNDLQKGEFYKILMDELQYTGTRDEFKVYLQSNYFNIEKFKRSNEIDNVISSLYPNMKLYIEIFDSSPNNKFKTIGTYAQRLESDVMIERICNNLIQEDIFVVSIHDALLIKEQDIDKVKTIMQNILEPHCNFKIKKYKELKKNFKSIKQYLNQQVPIYNTFVEVGDLGSIKNFKTHCRKIANYLQTNNIEVTEENLLKYSKAPLVVVKKIFKEFKPNNNVVTSDKNFIKVMDVYNYLILQNEKITAVKIVEMTKLNRLTATKYLKLIIERNVQ